MTQRRDYSRGRRPVGRQAPWMTTALAALCLLAPVGAARADSGDITEFAGVGIASAILTVPYAACKILYAGTGSVIGGFTWILSGGDTDAAQSVWEHSLYGTYVITPDHLRGLKPVRFSGRPRHRDDGNAP